MDGFTVDGSPVAGKTVAGKPVDITNTELPSTDDNKYGIDDDEQCSTNEHHPPKRTNRTDGPSSSPSPDLTWQSLIDQYGIEAVEEAKEAAPRNKRRSVKYVAGILRNWQREGTIDADDQPSDPAMSDADRQRLNELFAALGINRQI